MIWSFQINLWYVLDSYICSSNTTFTCQIVGHIDCMMRQPVTDIPNNMLPYFSRIFSPPKLQRQTNCLQIYLLRKKNLFGFHYNILKIIPPTIHVFWGRKSRQWYPNMKHQAAIIYIAIYDFILAIRVTLKSSLYILQALLKPSLSCIHVVRSIIY